MLSKKMLNTNQKLNQKSFFVVKIPGEGTSELLEVAGTITFAMCAQYFSILYLLLLFVYNKAIVLSSLCIFSIISVPYLSCVCPVFV